jgi:hypothetical protein
VRGTLCALSHVCAELWVHGTLCAGPCARDPVRAEPPVRGTLCALSHLCTELWVHGTLLCTEPCARRAACTRNSGHTSTTVTSRHQVMIISPDQWHIHPNIHDEGAIDQRSAAKAASQNGVIALKAGAVRARCGWMRRGAGSHDHRIVGLILDLYDLRSSIGLLVILIISALRAVLPVPSGSLVASCAREQACPGVIRASGRACP